MLRESIATAGWMAMGIITKVFSVPKTSIRWTLPYAAGHARFGTAALPWTHGWTKGVALMTGKWRTPNLQPVRSHLIFYRFYYIPKPTQQQQ